MPEPLLYISYGMAKAGSTLGFGLVTAVLEEAGIAQADVDLRFVTESAEKRFIPVIRPEELEAAELMAASRQARPIAIKTHGGLWKCVEEGLDKGWIIGHAICRDPRDIALSMLDASRENRAWGKRRGQPLRHIEDALDYVRNHAQKFEKWASHPAIMPIAYEPLAFDTEKAAQDIAGQLGVEVDAKRCAKMAHRGDTNRNKGAPRRHQKELSPDVAARIEDEFGDFIAKWCAPDYEPPKRGLLSRLIGR